MTIVNLPKIKKEDIKEESEIILVEEYPGPKKTITRYGFTQGSPLSPLLCAYAIQLSGL